VYIESKSFPLFTNEMCFIAKGWLTSLVTLKQKAPGMGMMRLARISCNHSQINQDKIICSYSVLPD
jgi:hypothetical protein